MEYKLGKICPIFKDDWNSTTTYERLDVVLYNGSSWVSTTRNTNIVPNTDSTWIMVAKAGSWETFTDAEKAELVNYLYSITNVRVLDIEGDSDLDITDLSGNVLSRFSDGHIKTKNFDSRNVINQSQLDALNDSINDRFEDVSEEIEEIDSKIVHPIDIKSKDEGDLDISDDVGNILARFENGHIKTKNFDSENITGGFNPWKGKTMLCMGASSIGGQHKGTNYTKYYGYPLRTCEVLEMNLINRMQYPRIYASGGSCFQYNEVNGVYTVYTDLTPLQFMSMTATEINYYHFQETRGDRDTSWKFVSYNGSDGKLVLEKNKIQHTFKIANSGNPLNGLFNLGSSATIQEFIDSGRSDRKGESFENFLLNPNIDLLVISDQGSQVDAPGQIDSKIVPLMRRGTLQNPHYYYSDGVSLEDRRNSNCGSILFLIDKFLSNNPNGRVIYCQDGMQPINGDGREEFGILKNSAYKRFQWTAYMCAKFGIPFLAHSTKMQQTYLTKDIWIAPDNIHPSDEAFKVMGEMFAGELLAGTNDISFMMYNFQLNE